MVSIQFTPGFFYFEHIIWEPMDQLIFLAHMAVYSKLLAMWQEELLNNPLFWQELNEVLFGNRVENIAVPASYVHIGVNFSKQEELTSGQKSNEEFPVDSGKENLEAPVSSVHLPVNFPEQEEQSSTLQLNLLDPGVEKPEVPGSSVHIGLNLPEQEKQSSEQQWNEGDVVDPGMEGNPEITVSSLLRISFSFPEHEEVFSGQQLNKGVPVDSDVAIPEQTEISCVLRSLSSLKRPLRNVKIKCFEEV